jgi:hypothetical protein
VKYALRPLKTAIKEQIYALRKRTEEERFLIKEIRDANILTMPEIFEDCVKRADCEAKSLYLGSSLIL